MVASVPEAVAVSKHSLAYWLFHAITFERKVFFENPQVKNREKPKDSYLDCRNE